MTVSPTETQTRLTHVPERHLAALRAALAGFSDADIGSLLGIPVESVPTTVRLAAAKLARVLADPSTGTRSPRDVTDRPLDEPGTGADQ